MSTLIRGGMLRINSAPCAKRFAVSTERETLADYVRRVRNEKRLSLREVSLRSGGQIANSHISRIESGEARGVSVDKLRSLAKGLGVPEDELFSIARGRSTIGDLSPEEWRIVHYYRSLPFERQLDLVSYSEMLFNRYGDQNELVNNSGPKAGKVYGAVASTPKAIRDKQKKSGKSSEKRR